MAITTTHIRQEASLELAANYGEAWTPYDWEFLAEFKTEDTFVIATAMGRSLYAVAWAKTRLDEVHNPGQPRRYRPGTWTKEQAERAMAEL